jgi:adenine phosphoribosyltransferase
VIGVGLLGVGVLADLALVQMVGIIAGALSSLLLATPLLVDLKMRDPRFRDQAERVRSRRATALSRAGTAPAVASGSSAAPLVEASPAWSPPTTSRWPARSAGAGAHGRGGRARPHRQGRPPPDRAGPGPAPDRQAPPVTAPAEPDLDDDGSLARAAGLVVDVPDFPHPGILFKDLTGVFADGAAFAAVATELAARAGDADVVAGIEARGFLLGAAVALVAGTGVVPVRKAGKLPRVAASRTYDLEYGSAALELPAGAITPGARVFVVDDVLATGGTGAAAAELLAEAGADVVGFGVLLELTALGGRDRLAPLPVHALLTA